VQAFVIINKFDINENMTKKIEKTAKKLGIKLLGKIPFDPVVNQAVNALKPIIDYRESKASKAIMNIYEKLKKEIV